MNGISLAHLDKLYYSIGEVSELLQINASNIRYWEKEFPKLKPKKSTRGNRKFTTVSYTHLTLPTILLV